MAPSRAKFTASGEPLEMIQQLASLRNEDPKQAISNAIHFLLVVEQKLNEGDSIIIRRNGGQLELEVQI